MGQCGAVVVAGLPPPSDLQRSASCLLFLCFMKQEGTNVAAGASEK